MVFKPAFIFSILISILGQTQSLLPLRHPDLSAAETTETALFKLKSLLLDSRYKICKEDLSLFLSTLSADDEKELARQEQNFDATKLLALMNKKRQQMGKNQSTPATHNKTMSSAHFLISHDKFKCEISIYPSLGDDSIKVTIDPISPDVTIQAGSKKSFTLEATLIGASANPKKDATIQYDPSKVFTILRKMEITNQKEQLNILEQFQDWQSRPGSAHAPGTLPPK